MQSVFSERPHMAKGDHSDDYNDIEVSNECIFLWPQWCRHRVMNVYSDDQTDVDIGYNEYITLFKLLLIKANGFWTYVLGYLDYYKRRMHGVKLLNHSISYSDQEMLYLCESPSVAAYERIVFDSYFVLRTVRQDYRQLLTIRVPEI